jgi:hypothetical protein
MTNQQCKETINALAEAGAIMFAPNNIWKAAELTLFGLEKRGYTITRTTPAPMTDEKLREALAYFRPHPVDYNNITLTASKCRKHISTIEAAISELQARRDAESRRDADSRRETMTEAELEREAQKIAKDMFDWVDSANAAFIVALAKKFRG